MGRGQVQLVKLIFDAPPMVFDIRTSWSCYWS
jgi:hypothetical protein